MQTIIRSQSNNALQVVDTVRATVKELAKNPGYIKIADIQNAINKQLDGTNEYVSELLVKRALATIIATRKK